MFNMQALLDSLPIVLYGMGGIFIVILIIVLCVKALGLIFPAKG